MIPFITRTMITLMFGVSCALATFLTGVTFPLSIPLIPLIGLCLTFLAVTLFINAAVLSKYEILLVQYIIVDSWLVALSIILLLKYRAETALEVPALVALTVALLTNYKVVITRARQKNARLAFYGAQTATALTLWLVVSLTGGWDTTGAVVSLWIPITIAMIALALAYIYRLMMLRETAIAEPNADNRE